MTTFIKLNWRGPLGTSIQVNVAHIRFFYPNSQGGTDLAIGDNPSIPVKESPEEIRQLIAIAEAK